jgi:CRISPR/Cas system-associated endoribonuclease Cas2
MYIHFLQSMLPLPVENVCITELWVPSAECRSPELDIQHNTKLAKLYIMITVTICIWWYTILQVLVLCWISSTEYWVQYSVFKTTLNTRIIVYHYIQIVTLIMIYNFASFVLCWILSSGLWHSALGTQYSIFNTTLTLAKLYIIIYKLSL